MRPTTYLRVLAVPFACLVLATGCGDETSLAPEAFLAPAGALRGDGAGESLAVGGAGLLVQPSSLSIQVAALSPEDILEAAFYWSGRGATPDGDATILIDGTPRTGEMIDRLEVAEPEPWLFFYRLDALGLVVPGPQSFQVAGFDPGGPRRGGIALVVRYRDPASPFARIRTVVPSEYVHQGNGAVWSFPLRPADAPRVGTLWVVAADAEASLADAIWWGAAAGDAPAGDLVGGGSGVFTNLLRSAYGPWLDIVRRPNLVVPAGAEHFALQIESPTGGDRVLHLFAAVGIQGDLPCEASIGDRAWRDDDRDGIQDPDEPGLAGVEIVLRDADGALLASTVTDADGAWRFGDLCAGDYLVEPVVPEGLEPSPCDAGEDDALDSECAPVLVALADDGAVDSGVDFGFVVTPDDDPGMHGCFRGAGAWARQMHVCLGRHRGHERYGPRELTALLRRALAATALEYGGRDGRLSVREARRILQPHRRRTPCDEARRHYLATLLNWALNGEDPTIPVDTDDDGLADTTFGEALAQLEDLLGGADETDAEAACRLAAGIATSINERSGGGCPE